MSTGVPPAWAAALDEYDKHNDVIVVIDLNDDFVRETSWPGILITPTTIEWGGHAYHRYLGTIESIIAHRMTSHGIWIAYRGKELEVPGEERDFEGTIQLCREYGRTRLVMFVLPKEVES